MRAKIVSLCKQRVAKKEVARRLGIHAYQVRFWFARANAPGTRAAVLCRCGLLLLTPRCLRCELQRAG
jgi:transposase-like protein